MPGDTSRANGKLGRGPKTPDGKSIVRFNRLRHGLFTEAVLVTRGAFAESRAELDRLRRAMFEDLRPVGANEEFMADRIAAILWRMRRSARVEAAAYAAIAERVEHTPGCASRLPSPMERALASSFDEDLRSAPCNCGAAARMEDNDGADRRLRTSVACLDLLRSVVRSEAHLSRELARAWAVLFTARQARGTHAALLPAPTRSGADEGADSDEKGDGDEDDSTERT